MPERGEWVPVYMKEDPQNVAHYRPVTLLPAVDKISEQLLCYQLRDKFETIFDNSMSSGILTRAHAMEYLPEWSVLYSAWKSLISIRRIDHKSYYANKDPYQAVMVINKWWKTSVEMVQWEFPANPKKYQAMIISNDSTQRDVEIDTFIVQPMDELKRLGVLIDRNLLFSNHISTVVIKLVCGWAS